MPKVMESVAKNLPLLRWERRKNRWLVQLNTSRSLIASLGVINPWEYLSPERDIL